MTNDEKITEDAASLIQRAKGKMVFQFPFYASLLFRLKTREDNTHPTAWVDGVTIGYNSKFVTSLTLGEVVGLLIHEVSHVAYMHPFRIKDRDHKKWNAAGDYVINWILKQVGVALPEGGLIDVQYAEKSTEHVYELIPDSEVSPDYAFGEVKPYPGENENEDPTPNEIKQMEQEWSVAVKQAVDTARMAGNLPACIEKAVEEVLDSSLPWEELLRNFMTSPCTDDYNWSRPNRRFIGTGLYLPSNFSYGLGEIVSVQDTSGSVSEKEKQIYFSEFNAIVEDTNPEKVYSMYVDTRVQEVDEVDRGDYPVKLRNINGGGTEFDPAFIWLEQKGITPACLIYFTDGYGYVNVPDPGYPVLWVFTSQKDGSDLPFGDIIHFNL